MNYTEAIGIDGANVYLGGQEILHNISWHVKAGERCFVLGANGAGKTTLVRTVMGFNWPKFGAKVQVLGHEFGKVNLAELRKRIAWVSPYMHQVLAEEHTGLELVLSALEGTLGLFRSPSPEEVERAENAMRELNCLHLRDRTLHTMSSGEQVKILIARALLIQPELMILDEPSVYLDIAGREFLLETIANLAKTRPELTMVFITQRIEDILPVFERGMILKAGRIEALGTREEVLTEENLKQAFGLNIRLIRSNNGRFWTVIE